MKTTISAVSFAALILLGSQAAMAFTYENQGTTQPSSAAPQTKSGYVDTDPGSLMPPIGQSIESKGYDFGPGAFNNGMAQQPTRGSSVGPSWLYPPGN